MLSEISQSHLLFFMYLSTVVSIVDYSLRLEIFSFPVSLHLILLCGPFQLTLLCWLLCRPPRFNRLSSSFLYHTVTFFLAFNTTCVLMTPKITCLCLTHAWYTRVIYASTNVIYQHRYFMCQIRYLVVDTLHKTFQKRTLDFTIYHNCSSLTLSNINECTLRDYCTKLLE